MMTDTVTLKKQCRPTATLKRLATVEAIFGYIMVPFYVVLQYVFPKQREKSDRQQGTIKGFIATWLKSIGIAVSAGALLGAVEWVLAKLLGRRLLDGIADQCRKRLARSEDCGGGMAAAHCGF